MRVALLGLQGSGKTTLFNAVVEKPVPNVPGAPQTETHVQVVKIHDPRLEACRDIMRPKKYTPASLEIWDPPGLPAGSSEADKDRRLRLLSDLREAAAYVIVARDFRTDSYAYERPEPDPAADLDFIVGELLTSDFVIAEKRAEKLRENMKRKGPNYDRHRLELAVLERCIERLEAGDDLSGLDLDEADDKRIRGFQFYARKRMLLLLNGGNEPPPGLGDGCPLRLRHRCAMDAQIDAELAALPPDERPAFMEEFGIEEAAAERFVREVYEGVGLRSFFTVCEEEVRAWTIRSGANALKAASKVHTDLARGFVRAEVYPHEALLEAGSLRELKARGHMRLEPKDYVVQDGDVVHIRSGV